MSKLINSPLDGWTEQRHLTLADAARFVWYPGTTVSARPRYALRKSDGGVIGVSIPAAQSRALNDFLEAGLIRRTSTGSSTYDRRDVARTPDGDRVLALWDKHKGSPVEPVLSDEARAHVAEFVALLEWHARRAGRSVGGGIGAAANLIEKAAGIDRWAADDNDSEEA